MADPHHVATLDGFDRMTVKLYRGGIVVSALALVGFAIHQALAANGVAVPGWLPRAGVLVGTALAVADLHLYDKRIRWLVGAVAWIGATGLLVGTAHGGALGHWVGHAGLGFLFVALSALALKERLCFRIWGLRGVPVLLAASLIPLLGGWPAPAAVLLGIAGLIYGALAVAKLKMPLHFDIGNKDAYQI